ncbi:MAG TPA: type II toxin-antitoxin system HicB family antitoxin [Enterobacteriaceae bacterium]|nr:type II toxin-antitoxin system HicB family antitoxin [Enterobacteriaceae bacterium]
MKYPIYLHRTENDTWSGFVPDLPGCYFAGDTPADAVADARSAIATYCEYLREKGRDIPCATTINDHKEDEMCRGGRWDVAEIV